MRNGKDEYSPEETARRRDAVLKILVNTPPQPHATRQGKPKERRKTTASGQAARKTSARQKKPD
jgi:hypothetical protein